MEEKYMVRDVLENTKYELTTFEKAIYETENMGLRQAFVQIRNNNEAFQYELFKVARAKGYYETSQEANQKEIENVKAQLE